MGPLRTRQLEHPFRNVDADHFGGAAGREIVRELAGTAAEVEHAPTIDVGQERQQVRVLGRALPAGAESLEG